MKKKENNNLTIEIKNSNYKDLGDIFEKIDEFDTIFELYRQKCVL